MFAEVLINSTAKELNKTFDYIVPKSIEDNVKVGARVLVPFGRSKISEGIIMSLKKYSEFANKDIIRIEDQYLSKENIELANIMARRYFCNVSDCIKLMLPPGSVGKKISNRVKEKTATYVYLKKNIEEIEFDKSVGKLKSEKQIRIIDLLITNDGVPIQDLEIITETSRDIIKRLEKNKYIEFIEKQVERNPFENKEVKRDKPLELTQEQKDAFEKINSSKFKQFLLYGVTGSR
ncbi:MAG: hypothetical protein IJN50_03165 [Clostridia bacterium]|nr:hypothetical protein [Clostridia bacterium]